MKCGANLHKSYGTCERRGDVARGGRCWQHGTTEEERAALKQQRMTKYAAEEAAFAVQQQKHEKRSAAITWFSLSITVNLTNRLRFESSQLSNYRRVARAERAAIRMYIRALRALKETP